VFTRAHHWSLSWVQSTPSHPISLRSILILSSHLCLSLLHGLLPSDFSTNILYAHLFHACYMPCPPHPPWLDNLNIWWSVLQVMKHPIIQSSPASCHFLLLRSKCSLQHPVLTHPHKTGKIIVLCMCVCVCVCVCAHVRVRLLGYLMTFNCKVSNEMRKWLWTVTR
jgi:hypothetical protein